MDMFSQEINGYNKQEVDSFIARMKTGYEAKLMEQKLKVLESERRVLDMQNQRSEIENKEKNIISALDAIEKAKLFQEEAPRNFYGLIMDKLEILVQQLSENFPQLQNNPGFENIVSEFSAIVKSCRENVENSKVSSSNNSNNDSMRLLLLKLKEHKKSQEPPKEVRIATVKPQEIPESESGFSFQEALNPTQDLAEIMKAFDFYREN